MFSFHNDISLPCVGPILCQDFARAGENFARAGHLSCFARLLCQLTPKTNSLSRFRSPCFHMSRRSSHPRVRSETSRLLTEAVARLDDASRRPRDRDHGHASSSTASTSTASTITPQLGYRQERLRLFRGPSSSSSSSTLAGSAKKRPRRCTTVRTWRHDFICLADKQQTAPPSPLEHAQLVQAGLGLKSLCFTDDDDGMSFHTQLLDSYPKLETGGGYDNLMSLL